MSRKAVSAITRRVKAQRRWYAFCLTFIGPFVKRIYRFTFDKCKIQSKTFLALANHTQNLDPALLVIGTRRHMRFVANASLTKGFTSIFLNGCFGIIPRQKGASGDAVMAVIEQNLKEGVSVGLFPEGNRCWDGETEYISRRTATLAKNSGAALVTYKLTGGYLLRPRWADTRRKGAMHGTLVHEYTPEELASMSEAEVYEAICRDLHVDAFEEQALSGALYPGENLAAGLERAAYLCPCCNSLGTIATEGDTVCCSHCGMKAVLNPAGRFESETLPFTTLLEWNKFQKKWMVENASMLCERVTVPIASDSGLKVTLLQSGCEPQVLSEDGVFSVYGDRFEIDLQGGNLADGDSLAGDLTGGELHAAASPDGDPLAANSYGGESHAAASPNGDSCHSGTPISERGSGRLVIPISETTGFGTFLLSHIYFNCGPRVRYQMDARSSLPLLKYYALWRVLSGREYL